MADLQVPNRVKLSALWATLMSLYIYNDYFKMYRPNVIDAMSDGRMGPLGTVSETALVAVTVVLAIPALMIALSAVLAPAASRWLNIFFALVYTAIEILTIIGAPPAYQVMVALEIATTLSILGIAVFWKPAG